MNNPFTLPITSEKLEPIKMWISEKINNRKLNFHDLLDKVKESSESNDKESLTIWCYYATNVILNSKKSDREKAEIISDLKCILDNI